MTRDANKKPYLPGFYGKKRMSAAEWANAYIKKWEQDRKTAGETSPLPFPMVCISRQIGVGALEVADVLAKIIGYRVVDREIIEHMSRDTRISEAAIKIFDERYPGWASEFFTMLTGEKTFLKSDYARQLVRTVLALAASGPTIFVGRGTHMILPGDTLLSVRLIASREYRVDRLSKILDLPLDRVSKELDLIDAEQRDFFKQVYNVRETATDEFDLIINRDRIRGAGQIARILASAFKEKFQDPGQNTGL